MSLIIDGPGLYCATASSMSLDTYLVVRDQAGSVLAENDDGDVSTDSSVLFVISGPIPCAEVEIVLDVMSGDNVPGEVLVAVEQARRIEIAKADQLRLAQKDLSARRDALSAQANSHTIGRARALRVLARSLNRWGEVSEALAVSAESCSILRSVLDPTAYELAITVEEMACMHLQHGHSDVAREALANLVQEGDVVDAVGVERAVSIYASLARACLDSGRLEECVSSATHGLALCDSSACVLLSGFRTLLLLLRSEALESLGRYEESLQGTSEILMLTGKSDSHSLGIDATIASAAMALHSAVLGNVGEYDQAERVERDAMRYVSSTFGEKSLEFNIHSLRLGRILLSTGRILDALQTIEPAYRAIRFESPGTHNEALVSSLLYAEALLETGRVDEGECVLAEARVLFASDKTSTASFAELGLTLAALLIQTGDSAAAVGVVQRAIEVAEKTAGNQSSLCDELRLSLCVALSESRQADKAITAIAESLERVGDCPARSPLESARRLSVIAQCLYRIGNVVDARERLEEAARLIAISTEVKAESLASVALSMGALYEHLGDEERSYALIREVLASREEDQGFQWRLARMSGLTSLASVCVRLGRFSEAHDLSSSGLRLAIDLFGADSPRLIEALATCSLAGLAVGRVDDARLHASRAIELLQKCSRVTPSRHYRTWLVRAAVAQRDNDMHLAQVLVDKLLSAHEHIEPLCIGALNSVSRLLIRCGEIDRAWYVAECAWYSALREALSSEQRFTEYEQIGLSGQLRECISQMIDVANASGAAGRQSQVYSAIQVWKGMVSRRVRRLEPLPYVVGALRQSIAGNAQELLNTAVVRGGAASDRKECDDVLSVMSQRRSVERLAVRRSGVDHDMYARDSVPVVAESRMLCGIVSFVITHPTEVLRSADEVSNQLSAGERVLAWVSRGDGDCVTQIDLGVGRAITEAIEDYLREVQACDIGVVAGGRDSDQDCSSTSRVRSLLWDPIAEHLHGVSTLCISPDGFLGAFPFECIVDKDGKYLIEKYSIVYGIEVGEFESGGSRIDPNAGGLIVGGVDRPLGADGQAPRSVLGGGNVWPPLKWAEEECSRIAGLFASGSNRRSTTILRGSEATESRVRESLPGASIVHFATHGFFPRSDSIPWLGASLRGQRSVSFLFSGIEDLAREYPGLLSGLVLAEDRGASPEEARDDGLLTAEEVSWLDLSKCELVVLSACGSGLGEARGGEGLIGLRRAFRMAGAKTVISSLWPISDRATAELMEMFYRNLLTRGLGRGEALRAAQLSMIQSNRAKYQGNALPTTWAAFVLDGDWK